jgi:hypothetical protein
VDHPGVTAAVHGGGGRQPTTAGLRRGATLALLLVSCAALYLLSFDLFQVGAYMDDAHYVVAARSLASGRGFSRINFPEPKPELRYPPGFPSFLVLPALAAPDALGGFKLVPLLFTLAAVPLWLRLLTTFLPSPQAWIALLCAASNPLVVGHASVVMSEAPFFFFLPASLLAAERVAAKRELSWRWSLLLAMLLAVLYFLRTVGMVSFLAVALYLAARRAVGAVVVVCTVFSIAAGLWAYRNATLGAGTFLGGYERQLVEGQAETRPLLGISDLIMRMVSNGQEYAASIIPHTLIGPVDVVAGRSGAVVAEWLAAALMGTVALLAFLGLFLHLRRGLGLIEASFILYFGVLLIWPWTLGRFLHPVLPLLYAFLLTGLSALADILPERVAAPVRRMRPIFSVLCVLLAINLIRDFHEVRNPVKNRITDLSVGATWIAENTPPESVVMTEFPVERFLYARRHTVDLPPDLMSDNIPERLERTGVDYVIVATPLQTPRTTELSAAARELGAALDTHPDRFPLMFSSPQDNVRVYRVLSRDRAN